MIEFTDEVKAILGRPNFACGQIARRLRELGKDIKEKAEDEQAHVIYFLLEMHEKHGKDYAKFVNKYLEDGE